MLTRDNKDIKSESEKSNIEISCLEDYSDEEFAYPFK